MIDMYMFDFEARACTKLLRIQP